MAFKSFLKSKIGRSKFFSNIPFFYIFLLLSYSVLNNNAMNYKEYIAYLPVVSLLMYLASLPFFFGAFQRICLYALPLFYVLDYVLNQRWKGWKWSKDKWLYVVFIALFLLLPLRQLFDSTPPTIYYRAQIDHYSMFLALGVVGLLGFSDKLKLEYVGYTMLLTSLVVIGFNIYLYKQSGEFFPFDIRRFNWVRHHHINYHMTINLYINTALLIGFYILNHVKLHKIIKIFIGILMAFIWGYVLLSDGRVGSVSSILIVFSALLYTLWIKNSNKTFNIIISCLIIACAVIGGVTFKNSKRRMQNEVVKQDPRFPLWNYAWRKIKEHPWIGLGTSSLDKEYVEKMYEDEEAYKGYIVPVILNNPILKAEEKTVNNHHTHNTFLQLWLQVGIAGVIVLLFLFVITANTAIPDKRYYVWMLLLIVLLQLNAEILHVILRPELVATLLFCFQQTCSPKLIQQA